MSQIATKFSELRKQGEAGLIAYVTAGDPDLSSTPIIVNAIIEGGADIVELGIPFSDPIADGPTIQAATLRALKAGTTPKKVIKTVEQIKGKSKVPIVILTYYNPIFRMGVDKFFESASACGVDGVIVPDLPVEEAGEYKKFAGANGVDAIFMTAPSTSTERLRKIAESTSGFLYLVSVFGVTGIRERVQDLTTRLVTETVRITRGKVPLAVGFGISKPEHVHTIVQSGADAVIVGSGFVKIVEREHDREQEMLEALKEYAWHLKKAAKRENRSRKQSS